jgi:hypothetical protein
MAHAVALVMIDIVKSHTIHRRIYQKVGDMADRQYNQQVKIPCRQRITQLLAEHSGTPHPDVGDQFTAHFVTRAMRSLSPWRFSGS